MLRPGQAAAAEASRRRAAESCAQLAREQLAHYWKKQGFGAPTVGLSAKWTRQECVEQAERDARKLLEDREKEKNLEERRNKLAMLLFHEDLQQKEELKTVAMQAKLHKRWTYIDAVPTSKLREINLGIKAKEEEQRRREAEILLYHQWRANQPTIREYEVKQRQGALKTAWMEQIVEKEINKEKEMEENEKILKERDEAIARQINREQEALQRKEEKVKQLQEQLCRQIQELRESERSAALLKKQEETEKALLDTLKAAGEVRSEAAQKRMAAKMTCLSNMAMQARRLKDRAKEAERDVEADYRELKSITNAILKDEEKENSNRKEWFAVLESALESLEKQKEIERSRQRHLDTIMDGEAKVIYERQEKIWRKEHEGRQMLLNDVLDTLKKQVQAKINANIQKQRQNIMDRELILEQIEKDNRQVEEMDKTRENKKKEIVKITTLQSEMKQLEREKIEKLERIQRETEIREAAKEEQRLRNEVMRLQREGSAFNAHRRRRIFL